MDQAEYFIDKYGVDVLFTGLESTNKYVRYYCINRLVEFYNDGDIRTRAIRKIKPLLRGAETDETVRDGAEFALSVLSGKFDSPYIVNVSDDIKVFALFNNYSDYGSYNELWIIRNGRLSKLHTFTEPLSHYIDRYEPIQLSPEKDKIAVQTCSRRSSSINIIYLDSGDIGPEIMNMALNNVAADNADYVNTYGAGTNYAGGEYSWGGNIKWIDDDTIEFDVNLAYNYMEIIECVTVRYNIPGNSLEYEPREAGEGWEPK
jgi:hypothetical protein